MKIYLDLLPQEKKNELRRNKIFHKILREEALFLLPAIVAIVILANIFYLLKLQLNTAGTSQMASMSQDKVQLLRTYEDKFAKTNDAVADLAKIQNQHLHWESLFEELNRVVPAGITITDISTKNYQVFFLGKAKVRDNLLEFKNNLINDQCFQSVNVPLSDLVTKEDIDFQMDLLVSKDCLLKKN